MRGLICGAIGFAVGIAGLFLAETRSAYRGAPRGGPAADRDPLEEFLSDFAESGLPPDESNALNDMFHAAILERELSMLNAELARRRDGDITDAAAALGVPDDVLRAGLDAYLDPLPRNVERVSQHGAAGFRALVALLRGGLHGDRPFIRLFHGSWRPSLEGEERALIDTADSDAIGVWSRRTALRALGETDTPAAREYLLTRLRMETDGDLFMCAAQAAEQLRYGRALPDLQRGLRNKDWSWEVRREILESLVDVAGERARDVLIDYLREPNADMLGAALFHLQEIDAESARDLAADLLAGPRADALTSLQLADLRHYAGEK